MFSGIAYQQAATCLPTLAALGDNAMTVPAELPAGPDRPLTRSFLREWRMFRGLNLREFSERIGLTASRMSRIEQGKEPYHQRLLERAAEICDCCPADILIGPPGTRPEVDLAKVIALQKKAQVLALFIEQLQSLYDTIEGLHYQDAFRRPEADPDDDAPRNRR